MSALQDRIEVTLERADSPDITETGKPMVSKNDPPVVNQTWCGHYNEEWAAFLAANSRKKSNAATWLEPEILPRVWNTPHG